MVFHGGQATEHIRQVFRWIKAAAATLKRFLVCVLHHEAKTRKIAA
jgi:hypothetical protein